MKVLLFANTAWYLYNFRLPLAEALRNQGHQVVLVSPADEPYHQLLQQAGFESLAFPFRRNNTSPYAELGTFLQIVKLYRKLKPDIVHHFTIKPVLYGSFAGHLSGIKTIINSVPGLGYLFITQNNKTRLLRMITTILYRYALKKTRVIFQNPDDLTSFLQAGLVQPQQTALIRGSGVDVNRFVPTEEPQGIPLVVLPARMLWDKGIREFVEAARNLKSFGISARFALVGAPDPGNPSSVKVEVLEKWHNEGIIEYWGWREDMLSVYHSANIICLPSYREGTPKSLVEAAACGRAIVTTDVPGCREVVIDGYNGLVAPVKDVEALASSLQKLIESPEIRRQMSENGRKLALAEFSVDRIVSETLSVYNGKNLQSQPLQI